MLIRSNEITPDGFDESPRVCRINQPELLFISSRRVPPPPIRLGSSAARLLLIYSQKVNLSLLRLEEIAISHQLTRRWSQYITGTC